LQEKAPTKIKHKKQTVGDISYVTFGDETPNNKIKTKPTVKTPKSSLKKIIHYFFSPTDYDNVNLEDEFGDVSSGLEPSSLEGTYNNNSLLQYYKPQSNPLSSLFRSNTKQNVLPVSDSQVQWDLSGLSGQSGVPL
jgi:hypothetical protein